MKKLTLALGVLICACTQQGVSNESSGNSSHLASNEKSAVEPADGPFGYSMGQSIDKLGLEKTEKAGLYQTTSPPKAHDDFEQVAVEAYPSTGICRIRGIGKNIEGDGSGAAVRGKVTELAEALATRYGEGHKLDRCSGGDIQCEGQFWMMTLDGGERYYGYEWTRQSEKMKAANIGAIDVVARAADISTSYPIVEYNSSNKAACEKARRASSASSL